LKEVLLEMVNETDEKQLKSFSPTYSSGEKNSPRGEQEVIDVFQE
jgi:hypothetical protein